MVILNVTTDQELKMTEISESEKKRLNSLKHKKEVFKSKELIVQNALKNLDNTSNNKKIIFDEDIDEVERSETKKKVKKRKRDLFDSDDSNDEGNEPVWDDTKFQIKGNNSRMFPTSAFTAETDERFKLDERFIEYDPVSNEDVTTEKNDELDLAKEKELQLGILENILGVPINTKNKDANAELNFARKRMIRYDPTKETHKEYEIDIEKPNVEKKKIQKKKKVKQSIEDTNENLPVEVSKDIYFSVSESLSKSLKEGGQFSLLNTYGNVENNEKGENNVSTTHNVSTIESSQPPKFQFDFKSKNPFKYDSSDDEHNNTEVFENSLQCTNEVFQNTNKFFFDANDTRFNEAVNFFCKEFVPDDAFKNLRHELKQIVRSKIRNNMKKSQPWGRKKHIKKPSKKKR